MSRARTASTHTVPLPLGVDLAERIRENRFTQLPAHVPLDQVGELHDVDPPADFEPVDEQARWLMLYGIAAL